MDKKILITVASIVAGAILGVISGAILGFVIGRGIDLLMDENSYRWRSLYGGISGTLAGLIAGAGTAGLGIRTRFSFEWPLIFGLGTLLGFWFQSGNMEADLGLIVGIGAVACWMVAHLARFIFRRWLPREVLDTEVVVVYFLIFGLVAFVAPLVMRFLGLIFSF